MKFIQLFPLVLLSFFFSSKMMGQCFSTQNYTTPGTYNYTLPGTSSNTYEIEITTRGADGGDFLWGSNPPSAGGSGALMTATYNLQGGDQLFIVVGESGFDAIGSPGGGGGGGGSAVIINSADVLIAAAAGGGGGQNTPGQGAFANTNSPAQGGAGPGTSGGGGFNQAGMNGVGGTAGGAGTLTSQGLGGIQGVVAGPGGDGFGGGAGGSGTAGGGGGGYKGGDGASNNSLNGKGGDSYITTLYGSTILTTSTGATGGGNNVHGSVSIVCNSFNGSTIPTISIISQMDPTCFGVLDGSITVSAADGTGGYMYSINGGMSTSNPVLSGLGAGYYTIVVTDSAGSTASVSTSLSQPASITINTSQVVGNDCNGGNGGVIEVSGQGGSGSFTYQLNGGLAQSSGLFENLPSGEHIVTVSDNSGCSETQNIFLSQPNSAITSNIFILQELDCFGGSNGQVGITLTGGTGELTASYNGISFTAPSGDTIAFTGLSASTITIDITDENGCLSNNEMILTEPGELIGSIASSTTVDCELGTNGGVTIAASGGTQPYSYIMGDTTLSGVFTDLVAGGYIVQIEDANGCMTTLDVNIGQVGNLIIDNSVINNLDCFGDTNGSVELMTSGGSGTYTYTLGNDSNSTGLFDNLAANDYIVMIVDGQGCDSEFMFTVTQPDELIISTDSIGSGYIRVTSSGGIPAYSYSIDGGNTFQSSGEFPNLTEGMYTIIVQDVNGCTNSMDVNITVSNTSDLDSGIQAISIYPTPTTSSFSLSINLLEKRTVSYQLYTLAGEMVFSHYEGILLAGQHTLRFDVSHLPEGAYVLKVKSDHGMYSRKIIKL